MCTVVDALDTLRLQPGKLKLTCLGFASVNWASTDNNFEFVFGNNQVCRVHPILAEFISPKISRLRRSDACTTRYVFQDKSGCVYKALDSIFLHLRQGTELEIEESNFEGLIRVSCELENDEILSSVLGLASLNSETTLAILARSKLSSRCQNLVKFVASHFHIISDKDLKKISFETAQILLSHPSLNVKDEDSVYDFVRSRSQQDHRFASLFEFVYFEYLSDDRIQDFACFAKGCLLEELNTAIWDRICRRLVRSSQLQGTPRTVVSDSDEKIGRVFSYDTARPLDGIIAYLTMNCGGNIHEKGVVDITASGSNTNGEHCMNAADLGANTYFASKDAPNSWICYNFKAKRVIPTSYSIRSFHSGPGAFHPKSWVLEGSNNGLTWETLDKRENNNDLNDKHVIRNFSITEGDGKEFEYLRLRQIGKNHYGDDLLVISSLELFGTLCAE